MFSKVVKVGDNKTVSVIELPGDAFSIEGITQAVDVGFGCPDYKLGRVLLSKEAIKTLKKILDEIDL